MEKLRVGPRLGAEFGEDPQNRFVPPVAELDWMVIEPDDV